MLKRIYNVLGHMVFFVAAGSITSYILLILAALLLAVHVDGLNTQLKLRSQIIGVYFSECMKGKEGLPGACEELDKSVNSSRELIESARAAASRRDTVFHLLGWGTI